MRSRARHRRRILGPRRLRPCGGCLGALLAIVLVALLPGAPAAAQDAQPPVAGEIVLSEGEQSVDALLVLRYRDAGAVPPELRRQAVEEGGESAVASAEGGGLELRFSRSELDGVVPILRRAREGLEGLPVIIRIPAELRTADVWTFQAQLSQAGIRQVRIVTDPPSFSMQAG